MPNTKEKQKNIKKDSLALIHNNQQYNKSNNIKDNTCNNTMLTTLRWAPPSLNNLPEKLTWDAFLNGSIVRDSKTSISVIGSLFFAYRLLFFLQSQLDYLKFKQPIENAFNKVFKKKHLIELFVE